MALPSPQKKRPSVQSGGAFKIQDDAGAEARHASETCPEDESGGGGQVRREASRDLGASGSAGPESADHRETAPPGSEV